MTLEGAIAFFIAIFIFGITPGPGIFALLARALTQGARPCIPLAFGMTISDGVYLVLAAYSLAAVAVHYAELFTVIRVVGAMYLLYLAWKMWTSPTVVPGELDNEQQTGAWASLIQGIIISASNPKVILFYIAFMPTFMDMQALRGFDIVLAAVLTISALMLGLMMVSYGAAQARMLIRSAAAMRRLNRAAAGVMAGAGAWLLAKS